MKLLYLHDSPISSEKANIIQALHMCYAFSGLGHDVTLAIPNSGHNQVSINKLIAYKMNKEITFSVQTYPKITVKGRFLKFGGLPGITRILKNHYVDCCIVRNPVIINAAIKNDIPTIFESHNFLLHNRYKIIDFILKKNLIKNSRSEKLIKFVTISNALAEIWKSCGVPAEKVIALHDGVDSDSFAVIHDKCKSREKLGLPLHKKIVIYAGSLYPNRGIENILKLSRHFPRAYFLILGGPEERKKYYIEICTDQNIKNIDFTGYIPYHKVKNYLFAADVLLMIWTKEVKTINYCSPLKMFEYMAAGRIIVGHAFPTIKEVLTDGDTAYLVDPDSFQELWEKMKRALNDSYPSEMAKRARILALKEYTWSKRASKILNSITDR